MSHLPGAYLALVALSIAAIWAAGRTKNVARNSRWSVPALAAIGLTLVALLMPAAAGSMGFLSVADAEFDASSPLLEFVPAILVWIAAIRCAHLALRQARDRDPATRSRSVRRGVGLAVSAIVFAYFVGLLIAAAALSILVGGGGE
jgi:hypothetical protein